ncbi:hypothetical protein ACP4OV_021240 [Aristida adscensionis]
MSGQDERLAKVKLERGDISASQEKPPVPSPFLAEIHRAISRLTPGSRKPSRRLSISGRDETLANVESECRDVSASHTPSPFLAELKRTISRLPPSPRSGKPIRLLRVPDRDETLANVESKCGHIPASREELLALSSSVGGGGEAEEVEVCSTPLSHRATSSSNRGPKGQGRGGGMCHHHVQPHGGGDGWEGGGEHGKAMAFAAAAAAAAGGGAGKLPPPNPNLHYQDNYWTDDETAALVAAWGSRYVELNGSIMRKRQWREVADAVNSRPGASARRRPPRTVVQCQNRVDKLKRKYKVELARSSRGRKAPSAWRFFPEMDRLIGPTSNGSASKRPSPWPAALFDVPIHFTDLPLPNDRRGLRLPAAALIELSDSEDSDDVGGNNDNYCNTNRL